MSEKKALKINKNITGKQLKIIGLFFLTVYSIGEIVLHCGMCGFYQYTPEQINQMIAADSHLASISGWASAMEIMVGVAIPIFGFLLVEGFKNSKNFWLYGLRIFLLALITEIPYNLACHRSVFYLGDQSPVLGLFICWVMLVGFYYTDYMQKAANIAFKLVIVLSAIAWCMLTLPTFGITLVLEVASFWILYEKPVARVVVGAVIGCLYLTGPISLYALYGYGGQRGNIKNRYVYYAYYPLLLLVLYGISLLF